MQGTSSIARSPSRSTRSSIRFSKPRARRPTERCIVRESTRVWANWAAKSRKSSRPSKSRSTAESTRVPTVSTCDVVVPIRNLSGHSMVKGSIHGSKGIPLVFEDTADRMEEGEIFAIETFASTGKGVAKEAGMTSHYALNAMSEYPVLYVPKAVCFW